MNNKKNKSKQIKMKVVIPDDIPLYFPSGFFGGLAESEGLIKLWVDDLQPKINENLDFFPEFVLKIFVANIKFSPELWKRMAYWMIKHVNQHEKKHGEIKIKGFKGFKPSKKDNDDNSVDYSFG